MYCGLEADIYPIRLWAFCAEYFPDDGTPKGYSGSEIEHILGWHGTPGNLVKALFDVGFIEKAKNEQDFQVHDWKEHAGFIKAYRINGKRNANNLWKGSRSVRETVHKPSPAKEKKRKEKNKDSFTEPPTTPVDNSVDNFKDTKDPKAPLTDVQKVVTVFKLCQGYEKDDKAWDAMYFGRFAKPAKALLDFLGSWREAGNCVQDVYEKLTAKGLTVTLETIAKHAGDWKKDKCEKEAGRGILSVQGHGNRAPIA